MFDSIAECLFFNRLNSLLSSFSVSSAVRFPSLGSITLGMPYGSRLLEKSIGIMN